jgi:hypothetical protein
MGSVLGNAHFLIETFLILAIRVLASNIFSSSLHCFWMVSSALSCLCNQLIDVPCPISTSSAIHQLLTLVWRLIVMAIATFRFPTSSDEWGQSLEMRIFHSSKFVFG